MSSSTIVIDPDDGHTADEVRYRRLLNGMAEGVVETTPSGEFITTNDAFAVMLGCESSEDLMAGVANAVDLYANSTRRNVEVRRVVDELGGVAEVEFRDKSGNRCGSALDRRCSTHHLARCSAFRQSVRTSP